MRSFQLGRRSRAALLSASCAALCTVSVGVLAQSKSPYHQVVIEGESLGEFEGIELPEVVQEDVTVIGVRWALPDGTVKAGSPTTCDDKAAGGVCAEPPAKAVPFAWMSLELSDGTAIRCVPFEAPDEEPGTCRASLFGDAATGAVLWSIDASSVPSSDLYHAEDLGGVWVPVLL